MTGGGGNKEKQKLNLELGQSLWVLKQQVQVLKFIFTIDIISLWSYTAYNSYNAFTPLTTIPEYWEEEV